MWHSVAMPPTILLRHWHLWGSCLLIQSTDFNGAEAAFDDRFAAQWEELERIFAGMSLHLKASDQEGLQGNLIFDPVGTNAAIKEALERRRWHANVPMPSKFDFLGTDVDFVRDGVLIEVQFSNYPFLLNNAVRAELLFKSRTPMAGDVIGALIMVTKAHMFPASNSTLYYEQAVNQLTELARNRVLEVPIRVVGLFSERGAVDAIFTNYHNPRYSRTVVEQTVKRVRVAAGRSAASRCRVTFA